MQRELLRRELLVQERHRASQARGYRPAISKDSLRGGFLRSCIAVMIRDTTVARNEAQTRRISGYNAFGSIARSQLTVIDNHIVFGGFCGLTDAQIVFLLSTCVISLSLDNHGALI